MVVHMLHSIEDSLACCEDSVCEQQSRQEVDAQKAQVDQPLGKALNGSMADLYHTNMSHV